MIRQNVYSYPDTSGYATRARSAADFNTTYPRTGRDILESDAYYNEKVIVDHRPVQYQIDSTRAYTEAPVVYGAPIY